MILLLFIFLGLIKEQDYSFKSPNVENYNFQDFFLTLEHLPENNPEDFFFLSGDLLDIFTIDLTDEGVKYFFNEEDFPGINSNSFIIPLNKDIFNNPLEELFSNSIDFEEELFNSFESDEEFVDWLKIGEEEFPEKYQEMLEEILPILIRLEKFNYCTIVQQELNNL